MRLDRILTIVLSILLIGSIVYSVVLMRRSEASVFTDIDGNITAISGFVFDADKTASSNVLKVEEPSTGRVFDVKFNDLTEVKVAASAGSSLENLSLYTLPNGSSVFVSFSSGGPNDFAQSIEILSVNASQGGGL